jgi:hypothetical protein
VGGGVDVEVEEGGGREEGRRTGLWMGFLLLKTQLPPLLHLPGRTRRHPRAADVEPSPHVRFIEPVADASPRDADVESSADVDVEELELEEDPLLLFVGEE